MAPEGVAPEPTAYRVGDIVIDRALACLRAGGEEQHLRPKAFQTLVYLIEHRDRFVSKEELMRVVWADAIVTDDALVQCVHDIRKALGDSAVNPRCIKTLPKVGYRFVAPVAREDPPAAMPIQPEGPAHEPRRRTSRAAAAAAILAIAAAAIVASRQFRADPTAGAPAAGARAVALMPFVNQSRSADLDWLKQGLPDMLIAGLARSQGLTVASRADLPQAGADDAPDVRLAAALAAAQRRKARLAVLGSFARLGGAIRIDVQVYDAATGRLAGAQNLTVESADHLLHDVDLLSLRLAAALGAADRGPRSGGRPSVSTDNVEAYRLYSTALERANAYDSGSAIELLERATKLDPRFAMAYARIGYIHTVIRVNEADEARPYFERAFKLSDRLSEKERLYIEAWYSAARSDPDGAERALRRIIAAYPEETEAYWRLGVWLEQQGHHDEAARIYERGLSVDPDAKEVWNSLGFLYDGLLQYDRAITAHQQYVALDPNEPNAHDSLAITYGQAGRWADAIAECDRALALRPTFHFAFVHKGDVLFQMGRYHDAISQYRRYVDVAPSDWDRAVGHHHIAIVLMRLGDFDGAAREARFEAELKNDFGTELRLALARGDRRAAARLRRRYFGDASTAPSGQILEPRDREYLLGLVALKSGEPGEALAHFRQALAIRHVVWGITSVEDCLAAAYADMGRDDDAVREYERIVGLNPRDALAVYHLARSHDRAGAAAEALAGYRRFLELWPDADANIPEVIDAKSRLAAARGD